MERERRWINLLHAKIICLCSLVVFSFGVALGSPLAEAQPFAYITNAGDVCCDSRVSVLDTATDTVVATVALVGGNPTGVAVNPAGTRLYVTQDASDNVAVIDTASNTATAYIPVGRRPIGIAINPAGTRVYVTNFGPAETGGEIVSVIDTVSDTVVATVPVGIQPFGVAVHPDGTKVYVASAASSTLSVIDAATNTVTATVSVTGPRGVAVHPDGTRVYVTSFSSDFSASTVSVIDTSTNTVTATVTVRAWVSVLYGIAVHPQGTRLYVTDNFNGTVAVINTASNTVIATVPVGIQPWGVAVHPDGTKVYIANQLSGTVSVIDTACNTVQAPVSVGIEPISFGQFIGPSEGAIPLAAFLHGSGGTANPPTLFLDSAPSCATTAKYKDSAGVKFAGGNLWKDIGTWPAAATFPSGTLTALSDLHVWVGLKNSDDQGTRFDLRAEVYKNGTMVAEGETLCITGVTRNPDMAKEVIVSFGPVDSNSSTDVLSLRVLTRIGTTGTGAFCGGHSNAVGLRLYFDAVSRNSQFDGTIEP